MEAVLYIIVYINGAGGMKISAYTIKRENVLNLYIMYGFSVRFTKIKTSWIKLVLVSGFSTKENQPPLHLNFNLHL